jgi:hypothetical protein
LAKAPDDRPASARVVYEALHKIAGEDMGLPGTLRLDAKAGQLVGREEAFAHLVRFLDL